MESKFDKIYEQTMYGDLITEEKILIAEGKVADIFKDLSNKLKGMLKGKDKNFADAIAANTIIGQLKQIKPTRKSKAVVDKISQDMEKTVLELQKDNKFDFQRAEAVLAQSQNKSSFDNIKQDAHKELETVVWELDPSTDTFKRKNWNN